MSVLELPFEEILYVVEGPNSVAGHGLRVNGTDKDGRTIFEVADYNDEDGDGKLLQQYYASDEKTNHDCQEFIREATRPPPDGISTGSR